MAEWHLITGEYPPQLGGVSDYTYLVASALADAGDAVHVWCPPSDGETPYASGVTVHRELGSATPGDLRRIDRMLGHFPHPRRLLVQWVPQAYGYRSMNAWFCWWLWRRASYFEDRVEIMVHEPFLPFSEGFWKQNAAAIIHRLMTPILLRAASRVWVSIPAWETRWRPYTLGRPVPFAWLPVPANVPVAEDRPAIETLRNRYLPAEGMLLGHFGTYGNLISGLLRILLPAILSSTSSRNAVLLLGRGSETFREDLIQSHPELTGRVHATGGLSPADASQHLSACDLMIQPYPDGVSTRRGSMMATLSHGLAIVTTQGDLSEPLWAESRAVALAPAGDVNHMLALVKSLLQNPTEMRRLSAAAKALYQSCFDLQHTITALRDEPT